MAVSRVRIMTFVAAGIVGAFGLPAAAAELEPSNKWRIEVSEGANSDGTISFQVTPVGGEPIQVSAPVKNGRGENGVARDIRDAFRATLDEKQFSAETDDGEDVLVKKRHGAPDFGLEFTGSTAKSVRIDVEKE